MKRFYGLKEPQAERTGPPWLTWGRGLVDYGSRQRLQPRVRCGDHAGREHFAQCLFSCLALTNKVYGSSMENVGCFSLFFFFFNCFCLKFDRLNYCKHSLFLCLRYWMENSIVCCWTVLEIFGQMCVNLAVMAFKANKQTKKKSCENGLGALSLVTWRVSSFVLFLNTVYVQVIFINLEKTINQCLWENGLSFEFSFLWSLWVITFSS